MELFNLDELVSKKRKVQLFGCEYVVADRTVGQMIAALNMAKDSEVADAEVIIGQMIEAAHQIIPDCPAENLNRLNMKQLQALISFASESEEGVEEAKHDEGK